MNIKILLNRTLPFESELPKVTEFFKTNDILVSFTTQKTDLKCFTSSIQATFMGGMQYQLDSTSIDIVRPYAKDCNILILALNGEEFGVTRPSGKCHGFITGTCVFINVNADEWSIKNTLWVEIAHEIMHALVRISISQGKYVEDIMDTYRENNNPYSKTGNFSEQLAHLRQVNPSLFQSCEAVVPIDTKYLSQWRLTPQLEIKAHKFLLETKKKGYNLKITQGWREPAYQDKLYAQGRTIPGKIVTNATGKTSKHCLGRAFDFAYIGRTPYPTNGKWKEIGAIGKNCGLIWGGDFKSFKDLLHFEV